MDGEYFFLFTLATLCPVEYTQYETNTNILCVSYLPVFGSLPRPWL